MDGTALQAKPAEARLQRCSASHLWPFHPAETCSCALPVVRPWLVLCNCRRGPPSGSHIHDTQVRSFVYGNSLSIAARASAVGWLCSAPSEAPAVAWNVPTDATASEALQSVVWRRGNVGKFPCGCGQVRRTKFLAVTTDGVPVDWKAVGERRSDAVVCRWWWRFVQFDCLGWNADYAVGDHLFMFLENLPSLRSRPRDGVGLGDEIEVGLLGRLLRMTLSAEK